MHRYENECVGCPPELSCIGNSCPYNHVLRFYCDECGEECEKLYYWCGDELCIDCIERELDVVEGDDDY